MSEGKPVSLSPDGTEQDWERLLYVHTVRVTQAKDQKAKSAAIKELRAIQQSLKLFRQGKPPPRLSTGPSLREELVADLKREESDLRPDQLFTEEELREKFGTGVPCPACGEQSWDVGQGPHCCCTTGVPTPVQLPALPGGNTSDSDPF